MHFTIVLNIIIPVSIPESNKLHAARIGFKNNNHPPAYIPNIIEAAIIIMAITSLIFLVFFIFNTNIFINALFCNKFLSFEDGHSISHFCA